MYDLTLLVPAQGLPDYDFGDIPDNGDEGDAYYNDSGLPDFSPIRSTAQPRNVEAEHSPSREQAPETNGWSPLLLNSFLPTDQTHRLDSDKDGKDSDEDSRIDSTSDEDEEQDRPRDELFINDRDQNELLQSSNKEKERLDSYWDSIFSRDLITARITEKIWILEHHTTKPKVCLVF